MSLAAQTTPAWDDDDKAFPPPRRTSPTRPLNASPWAACFFSHELRAKIWFRKRRSLGECRALGGQTGSWKAGFCAWFGWRSASALR